MKFAEMLSFLEEGKIDGIISWHSDRLTRNSVDGGKIIHFIDVDKNKALKVKKLFELYSTGGYTLKFLANWCKEKNLRGNLNKEIAVSNIQKILQNIFYIGLMKYHGEIFEGHHEPLISKKLFDKCQEVMNKRGKVQEVKKHNFAFLGLLKCASCGASITAEIQKGHNYYRCTKKKGLCQEKHYLREEALTAQIKSFLQKVSLSSQDTKKVLAALDSEQDKAREDTQSEITILKEQLAQVETKLQKLLDIYLADALSTEEYAAKKQSLLSQKVSLSEKITDFETKGLSWLEPAREFVKSLNQAAKLIETENKEEMPTFLKNIGSNHILRNRQLVFAPKIEYKLVAERGEANQNSLTFPTWCRGEDSNLHGLPRLLLRQVRLPISPPRHKMCLKH